MLDKFVKTELTKTMRLGALSIAALFFSLVSLSWFIAINGAVVAVGNIGINGKPKVVQHIDGGVIDDIFVQDGQHVNSDSILAVLDSSLLEANLEIYRSRLSAALATKSRLIAEQVGDDNIEFQNDNNLLYGFDDTLDKKGQLEIFNARRELNIGKKQRIQEKINQFQNQVNGISGQITSLLLQEKLIKQEVSSLNILENKGLIPENQLLSVKRSLAVVQGDLAERRAELSRIRNSINDAEIELLQEERTRTEEIVNQLRESNSTIHELTQQIVSTTNKLNRVEIKSPIEGIVHELAITTIGGVVRSGEIILQVIPINAKKEVIVRVDPVSIDQIYKDQRVKVRFSSFNQNVVPELEGRVEYISADTSLDESSGQTYYSVRVEVPEQELRKLGSLELLPGMPVEAYIQTTKRTIIGYLTKPLTNHILRAFNED
ncbi:HlyD family type I secretion periplasmic adaptor subunit [Grimontia marina]|uniref:Membrane fusion protein (MFP) family protein n=1 Tax=Grimontia marina TaxID=646534 RepID=A0A128F5D9_9GAMM|nr:HlyD family type I secretion periplasmic adaptor subunit [Grimontia marina]CZF81511.1 Type I secretion system membrane fusion protein PrsE [Grimontia marina]